VPKSNRLTRRRSRPVTARELGLCPNEELKDADSGEGGARWPDRTAMRYKRLDADKDGIACEKPTRPLIYASCTAMTVAVALAVVAVATRQPVGASAARACGVELWSLKTLSDPQRGLINLHPRNTTVAGINGLLIPHPTPRRRSTGYERRTWRVKAQIVQFKLEDDSDIHLILFDRGSYLIAEMPFAACLPARTRDRRAIVNVRRLFERRCRQPSPTWQNLGAVVVISGAGFWDFPHGQSGHARNYAELHPVTGLRILAGC
jgi:hypothetical protein